MLMRALVFGLVLLTSSACAAYRPPPMVTGQARTLWYANEVAVALNTVQHAAIELNKIPICDQAAAAQPTSPTAAGPLVIQSCRPLLSDDNTRAVGETMNDARAALRQTPNGWAAIAVAALDRIQLRLDSAGQTKLAPYLQMVRFLLNSFVPEP